MKTPTELVEENLDQEWYEESLAGSPFLMGMPCNSVGGGIEPLQKQYWGVLAFFEGKRAHYFTLVSDQDIISKEILLTYLKDKQYYKRWFSKWKQRRKKFLSIFREVLNTELSNLADDKLFDLYRRSREAAFACRDISMMIDGFTFGSERRMAAELQKYCSQHKIPNPNRLFAVLTAPEQVSFTNKYELELIDIARRFKKSKKLRGILNKPKELAKLPLVKEHLSKYCWYKGSWGYGHPYKIEHFVDKIKTLLKKDLESERKNKKQVVLRHREQRKRLLNKYQFNQNIRALSNLTIFMTHWQDLRKEKALKFIHAQTLMAQEFARRFRVRVDDLLHFDPTEYPGILKDRKRFLQEAKKRRKLYLMVYAKGKVYPICGPKVKYYLKKVREIPGAEKVSEVKGTSAFPGKVRGKVRIAYHTKEFRKFKKGEILITGMTRPEFTPILDKAAAIVTDDGGIACHAAVVSRELKKPCVVGTRFATRAFQTGDMVEVDAERGVVKKL